MPIHHLHEPIDVFSEWLDACEAAEKGNIVTSSGGGTNDQEEQRYVDRGGRSNISNDNGEKANAAAYASLGLDDSDDDDSD
jgi:transcription elongation factor Elf1